MTTGKLIEIFKKYHIPNDATILSDSGWEDGPTRMDGIYYNKAEKKVVFTQRGTDCDYDYYGVKGWKRLHFDPKYR